MLDKLYQLISSHWTAIGFALGYALIAAVNNLPLPGTQVTFYEFFYNWTRSMMNSPTLHRFSSPIPNDQPSKGAVTK